MADEPTMWEAADAYERYVGRWSEQVAREFVEWLALPDGLRWLDVGCGTGALSRSIAATAAPRIVHGIDRSDGFVEGARRRADRGGIQRFSVGDALDLPVDDATFDVAVSGLVLNFLPDATRAVSELRRSLDNGGTVALYVWDYAEGMQLIRYFWDAAIALDPAALALAFRSASPRPSRSCSDARASSGSRRPRSSYRRDSRTSMTTGRRSWVARARRPPMQCHLARSNATPCVPVYAPHSPRAQTGRSR
jgi:SAM-dependent methyltransferase